MRDFGIVRAKDTPKIDVILIEVPDELAATDPREWARSDAWLPPARWLRRCILTMGFGGLACRWTMRLPRSPRFRSRDARR